MIFVFTIITFISTLAGGLFALRYNDKLRLILGFTAGAVLGVCFFDLLPESFSIGNNNPGPGFISLMIAVGFFVYMLLNRISFLHRGILYENGRAYLSAGSLSLHSLFDGIAIGLSFQISNSFGASTAIAVIVHDFSDGLNTVNLVLKNNGSQKAAFKWLLVDSVAPVLGVISTFFFRLSSIGFAVCLALFSGFFLYIGASDILPESNTSARSIWAPCMVITGAAVIYFASRIIAHF
ncbi:MAG: ZIP family metal transporter [Bacteroidetes bacterium]|nr:ZIP family metal transporter [Bacteroidota bacterium]